MKKQGQRTEDYAKVITRQKAARIQTWVHLIPKSGALPYNQFSHFMPLPLSCAAMDFGHSLSLLNYLKPC